MAAERPVIASLLEDDLASRATAERAGALRLIYADRTLDAHELSALLA